jgi:hypothetical protein
MNGDTDDIDLIKSLMENGLLPDIENKANGMYCDELVVCLNAKRVEDVARIEPLFIHKIDAIVVRSKCKPNEVADFLMQLLIGQVCSNK